MKAAGWKRSFSSALQPWTEKDGTNKSNIGISQLALVVRSSYEKMGWVALWPSDQRGEQSELNSSAQLVRSSKWKSAAFPSPVAGGLMGESFALMRHHVWPASEPAPRKKEGVWQKEVYMGCSQWGFFASYKMLCCTECRAVVKTSPQKPNCPQRGWRRRLSRCTGCNGAAREPGEAQERAAGCWGSLESRGHVPESFCLLHLETVTSLACF